MSRVRLEGSRVTRSSWFSHLVSVPRVRYRLQPERKRPCVITLLVQAPRTLARTCCVLRLGRLLHVRPRTSTRRPNGQPSIAVSTATVSSVWHWTRWKHRPILTTAIWLAPPRYHSAMGNRTAPRMCANYWPRYALSFRRPLDRRVNLSSSFVGTHLMVGSLRFAVVRYDRS